MGFSTNYENTDSYDLIPQGDYEVIIRNAEERTTKNGAQKIGFSLVIRNDVEQGCKNRYLFLDIWKKREPNQNDCSVDGYNYNQLMQLARVTGIPNGKSYDSVEAFAREMVGRCIRVTVEHNTYNGKTSEKIDQLKGVHKTNFSECNHVYQQNNTTAASGTMAQRKTETFANQPPAVDPAFLGDIGDFEELPSGVEVPF